MALGRRKSKGREESKGPDTKVKQNTQKKNNERSKLGKKLKIAEPEKKDILTRYTAKLFDLQHQIEVQKDSTEGLFGIESEVFSIIRESMAAIFSINMAFTYEEFEEKIDAEDFSPELKENAKKVASDLNTMEYGSEKSYEQLSKIVEDLIRLYYAYFEGRIPKAGEQKKKRRSIITRFFLAMWWIFKGITFVIWFPFYIFFVSLHNFREKRHMSKDPTYKITRLIKKGEKQVRRKKMIRAVATYNKISEEYDRASNDLKALVRSRIIEYYSEIMREHARLKSQEEQ